MTNLAQNLLDSAAKFPDHLALRQGDRTLTFAELNQRSARAAELLAGRGVSGGDRVALMMPNTVDFPIFYYGALRLGAVVVPFNPLLKEREVRFLLEDSDATALVAVALTPEIEHVANELEVELFVGGESLLPDSADEPSASGLVACEDSSTAVLLYTSGTTGSPKGAELTHGGIKGNTQTIADTLFHLTPDDVVFGGLPLFHVFGQTCGMNAAIAAGATLTLLPKFNPADALSIFREHKVTALLGVPTMYVALVGVAEGYDSAESVLRIAGSGGASLPVEVLRAFESNYGVKLLEGYGLSETSPVVSFNHPERPGKPGSIGTPVREVEMAVVDTNGDAVAVGEIGEIVVRGPNVMKGYWKRPDATAAAIRNEWFHTGDLGRVDDDGYYFIVDRMKDMIIRGGYNVYPREIEEVLYEHPAVVEAAVIGIPDPKWGEEIAAVVSVKAGTDATAEEIKEYVKDRVAAYKYPRQVWIMEALPKGATGKILKREIDTTALADAGLQS